MRFLTVYLNDVYRGANSIVHSETYFAYSAVMRAVCAAVGSGIFVTLFAEAPGPYSQYCQPLGMEMPGVMGRPASWINGRVFA